MTNEERLRKNLARPFRDNEVHWRVERTFGDTSLLLCYLNSRSVQVRLDEVVGPFNWENAIRIENGVTVCGIGIWTGERTVWKWDGSGERAMHGPQAAAHAPKAGISDGFKRAAVMWGMGRHLYDLGDTRVQAQDSYPRGVPKHYIVRIPQKGAKAKWAVAPSLMNDIQPHLYTDEDRLQLISDPDERRKERIKLIASSNGWGFAQLQDAFLVASSRVKTKEGKIVQVISPGIRDPRKADSFILKIASHRLQDWNERGTIEFNMDFFAKHRNSNPPEAEAK